jgi:hypothetical protein
METLREKQSRFALMASHLIMWAFANGFEVTFGDAYRAPTCIHGHKSSLHRKRLAIDLNLFKDGNYLTETEDYEPLGIYWESLGGYWGGRFNDGNHF